MYVETKKLLDFDLEDSDMIFDCQFYPEKLDWAAISTIEGDVKIINFENDSNDIVLNFKKHHNGSPIRKVRFWNNLMFTVSKTIKITDLNTQKLIRKIPNGKQKIYSLLIADNYLVCVGDDEGNFNVWDYRVKRPVHMSLKECDGYISDMDIDRDSRLVVASSGEGTLTAFNIRAKRMEPPQSELFDAGFQCVRFVEEKNKTVVGTEDGVINIFNINEWGNISDRYPIKQNNNGVCSIDCMEILDETDNVFVIGSSDGSLQAVSLFPHKELSTFINNTTGIENLDVNQVTKKVIATSENNVKLFSYDICKNEVQIKKFKQDQGFFAGLAN